MGARLNLQKNILQFGNINIYNTRQCDGFEEITARVNHQSISILQILYVMLNCGIV